MTLLLRHASILLTAVILVACSTPASRIKDDQNTFDAYPVDVQQRIRLGQISIGFTQDQVRMAAGDPSRRYTLRTATGESEIWAYSKSNPVINLGLGVGTFGSGVGGGVVGTSTGGNSDDKLRVTFIAGKVIAVEVNQQP